MGFYRNLQLEHDFGVVLQNLGDKMIKKMAHEIVGDDSTYYGDLYPEMGEAIWDEEEKCWAVRVQEEDVPYSCGVECCGVAEYAVVARHEVART